MKMRMEGSEGDMNMKMRWELFNRDPKRGNAKEREGENTNTNTPGPERANPEKAREKKSGGRRRRTKTSGGGEDGRAWTNLPQRNLSLPKHARTQTYLERGARMKLGTNGGWWKHRKQQKEKEKNTGIQFRKARFVHCSHYGTVVGQPTSGHVTAAHIFTNWVRNGFNLWF